MKKLIFLPILFAFTLCIGQNVKLEIGDYHKVLGGKEYSTYQFANASYSHSRASVVFVTSKSILYELSQKIPKLYIMKQEYTDVWILGIDKFDKNNVSELDKNIIDLFFASIIKYRSDNDLPPYTREKLQESKIFLEGTKELCKYIRCGK
jgi:hypothetical protein